MNFFNNLKALIILSCLYCTAFVVILSGYPARVSLEVKGFYVKVTVEKYLLTNESPYLQCPVKPDLPGGEKYASR